MTAEPLRPALAARVRAGDVRAAATLMRDLDDDVAGAVADVQALRGAMGQAFIVGITGAPGSGKSTLVDQLIVQHRAKGERVGVVAIDPSSSLSGGALLGDRVRMQRHAVDPGVFIRSLATRGSLGGLSRSAGDVIDVMDAMGFSVVLVETVGVGQDEIDVVAATDATVVVATPGQGDGLQAIKAGLVELADILVVNKADAPGADTVVADFQTMLQLREVGNKTVPIVKVVAQSGAGVTELLTELMRLRQAPELEAARQTARLRRARARIEADVTWRLGAWVRATLSSAAHLDAWAEDVAAGRSDPHEIGARVMAMAMASLTRGLHATGAARGSD